MRVTQVELVWPGKYGPDGTRRQPPVPRLPLVREMVVGGQRPPRRRAEPPPERGPGRGEGAG
jgi:hypothetical protein